MELSVSRRRKGKRYPQNAMQSERMFIKAYLDNVYDIWDNVTETENER